MIKSIKNKRNVMQSKIIFVVLIMLSFSTFHDSFISLLDKNEHTPVVQYINDNATSSECTEINKIHSMFHFMAIVTTYKNNQIQLPKRESIPHLLVQHSPPVQKTSLKPPIV